MEPMGNAKDCSNPVAITMSVRTNKDKAYLEELELKLKVIEDRGNRTSFAFAQAVRSILTALEYNDDELLGSHLETAKQCFIDLAEEKIADSIKDSKDMFMQCEKFVDSFASQGVVSPSKELDDAGEQLQKIVQLQLKQLTDLQRSNASAFDEIALSGSGPLQNEINRWREFENSYLKEWPWGSRKRKPVDRAMLAEAKRSRERGETGIPVEDLINKLKCQ
jgi:hypothetical protein